MFADRVVLSVAKRLERCEAQVVPPGRRLLKVGKMMTRTLGIALAMSVTIFAGPTFAQTSTGGPSATSMTGDPAASSASSTPSASKPSPSGSGTSTSGGKDANGDGGRDKAPGSGMGLKSNEGAGKH